MRVKDVCFKIRTGLKNFVRVCVFIENWVKEGRKKKSERKKRGRGLHMLIRIQTTLRARKEEKVCVYK